MAHRFLRPLFWGSLVLTLACLFALAVIDEHLKSTASPLGIVSFELCAFQSTCAAITASWDAETKLYASMSLGLDYLFMLTYSAAISCGLWLLVKRGATTLRTPMVLMSYTIWFAGLADVVENYHLFQMLMGQPIASHQWPATLSATVKFACLLPSLTLWLLGSVTSALSNSEKQAVAT